MSGDIAGAVYDFSDAEAFAYPKIENIAFSSAVQMSGSENMSICKICYVNIVSYAGSIRSIVIISVYAYEFSAAKRNLQYKRDKMGFRIVRFSDPAAYVSSAGIEISE